MSGKCCNHMLIVIIAIFVSSMKVAIGQIGVGKGYAQIPKGAYSAAE